MELELLHFLCFKLSTLPVDKGKPEFDPRATVCINFPGEVSSKYLKILMSSSKRIWLPKCRDSVFQLLWPWRKNARSTSRSSRCAKYNILKVFEGQYQRTSINSIIIQINSYSLAEKITLPPPQSRVQNNQNISKHWELSEQRVPSMQRYLRHSRRPRFGNHENPKGMQNCTCLHNLRHIHVDVRRFHRAVLASWLEHNAISDPLGHVSGSMVLPTSDSKGVQGSRCGGLYGRATALWKRYERYTHDTIFIHAEHHGHCLSKTERLTGYQQCFPSWEHDFTNAWRLINRLDERTIKDNYRVPFPTSISTSAVT